MPSGVTGVAQSNEVTPLQGQVRVLTEFLAVMHHLGGPLAVGTQWLLGHDDCTHACPSGTVVEPLDGFALRVGSRRRQVDDFGASGHGSMRRGGGSGMAGWKPVCSDNSPTAGTSF